MSEKGGLYPAASEGRAIGSVESNLIGTFLLKLVKFSTMSRSDRIRQRKNHKRKGKHSRPSAKSGRPFQPVSFGTDGVIPDLDYTPHPDKLSTILPAYAEPLLEYANNAEEAAQLIKAAARYWNWSFEPEKSWRKEIGARFDELTPEDRAIALRDIPMMIERKHKLYPNDPRRIAEVNVRVEGESLRVNVVAMLSK